MTVNNKNSLWGQDEIVGFSSTGFIEKSSASFHPADLFEDIVLVLKSFLMCCFLCGIFLEILKFL